MSVSEKEGAVRPGVVTGAIRRPIPGEHGAWGALLTGVALGVALAVRSGGPVWAALGVGMAAVDLFMMREALYQAYRPRRARDPARQAAEAAEIALARRWVLAELGLLLALGALLVAATRQAWLLGVGAGGLGFLAIFVLLRRSRQERAFWSEVVGFVGMSAAGPAAYLLARSTTAPQQAAVAEALLLWLLLALYFVGPIFYVKMKVAQQRVRPATPADRLRVGRGTLLYSVAVAAVLSGAATLAGLGWWPLLAYTPSLAKNLVGIFRIRLPLNLRRIGFLEVGLSLLFAAGLYAALG